MVRYAQIVLMLFTTPSTMLFEHDPSGSPVNAKMTCTLI
jgi:hypothetical protein